MRLSCIGISRHRIGRDGVGVTTLVGAHGCPLDCKYCLNPQCKNAPPMLHLSVDELYERVRVDSLYFSATNGGIVFGGGEPLLQAEYIREFILYTKEKGEDWRFTLETSLAISSDKLKLLDGLIDEYIVDVKDMDGEIYKRYTGVDQSLMRQNLSHLSNCSERVILRVPLIYGYNTKADTLYSVNLLKGIGYTRFDVFAYKIPEELFKERLDSKNKM